MTFIKKHTSFSIDFNLYVPFLDIALQSSKARLLAILKFSIRLRCIWAGFFKETTSISSKKIAFYIPKNQTENHYSKNHRNPRIRGVKLGFSFYSNLENWEIYPLFGHRSVIKTYRNIRGPSFLLKAP